MFTVHVLDRRLRVGFILKFDESKSSVGVGDVVLRYVYLGREQALLDTDAPKTWFVLHHFY